MANNQQFYRSEHQQRKDSGLPFHSSGINIELPDIKRINRMAQTKMILILCDLFGIPITFLGIIANMDNIKSAVLAILSISYLMLRGYFYFVKSNQSVRDKELELWGKEMDKQERIKKMNENSSKK